MNLTTGKVIGLNEAAGTIFEGTGEGTELAK